MKKTKAVARTFRKLRIRKKIAGVPERPRLVVYRSNTAIYAQLVDDQAGAVIAAYDSRKIGEKTTLTKDSAAKVGAEIARLAKEKNIDKVVFDRNGFLYHGRVKALADAAREAGLSF